MNNSKRAPYRYLTLALVLFLAACQQDISSVIQTEDTLTLQVYEPHSPVFTTTIAKGSDAYSALVEWAQHNHEGWSPSITTYVPHVLIIGRTFQLNITSSKAIYGHNTEQYEKPISAQDFEALRRSLLPALPLFSPNRAE